MPDPSQQYATRLSPEQEQVYAHWRAGLPKRLQYEGDYDLRGAFAGMAAPDANAHLEDTYKLPNHPSFSVESQYAPLDPAMAGTWTGPQLDQYRLSTLRAVLEAAGLR